ncbi:MAG: hypothetical protein QOF19_160 [Alphaproteobacteria bacterium]|nr:hypothetical protein [Alphaproteobacteria bacterium]
MNKVEARTTHDRRVRERRSGVDARSEAERLAVGERRSGADKRSGMDRRAAATIKATPRERPNKL